MYQSISEFIEKTNRQRIVLARDYAFWLARLALYVAIFFSLLTYFVMDESSFAHIVSASAISTLFLSLLIGVMWLHADNEITSRLVPANLLDDLSRFDLEAEIAMLVDHEVCERGSITYGTAVKVIDAAQTELYITL